MDALTELLKMMSEDQIKNDRALLDLCEKIIARLIAAEEQISVLTLTVAKLEAVYQKGVH
jgi:hypothetical protein